MLRNLRGICSISHENVQVLVGGIKRLRKFAN
jgi:hypothetical protein